MVAELEPRLGGEAAGAEASAAARVGGETPGAEPSATTRVGGEVALAVRNGVLLAFSLVGTLAIAIAVRVWLPRFLGPAAFGRLNFAESVAAGGMFFTTLGVEIYIEREIAVRPGHASEFFGDLLKARLLASLAVSLGLAALLAAMHRPAGDYGLVFLFAAGQAAFVLNGSTMACLQAVGEVREVSLTSLGGKLLWGAMVGAGLALGLGLAALPIAFLASEALKAPLLLRAARRHLGLRLELGRRLSFGPVRAVLAFSFPFYVNQLAHELYGRIGITTLTWVAPAREAGWYGAANNVLTLALLLLPVLNAVILPMTSRVAAMSGEALDELMRSATRLLMAAAVPGAFLLALGAPVIVRVLFSAEFAPAASSLRLFALLVPFTSYCVLAGMHLLQLGRVWQLVRVSVAGLAVAVVVNPIAIHLGARLGPGGASAGAAASAAASEIVVALLMLRAVGPARLGRGVLLAVAKLVGIGVVVSALHGVLTQLGLGLAALVLATAVYLALGAASGVIPLGVLWAQARLALGRRRGRGGDVTATLAGPAVAEQQAP